MYSRSFYPDSNDRVNIPQNYDGTMFPERENTEFQPSVAEVSFPEVTETGVFQKSEQQNSLLDGLRNLPFLSGIFGKEGFLSSLNSKSFKFGTEEILIIATAAFLLFSKNGDRECGLLLLLLLLIN